jgi:hypothetical protein
VHRCDESTNSDYVSFSNFAEAEDRKLYRLCSQQPNHTQHKIESDGAFFRVTFKSNHKFDGIGFDAFYQFRGQIPPRIFFLEVTERLLVFPSMTFSIENNDMYEVLDLAERCVGVPMVNGSSSNSGSRVFYCKR